MVLIQFNHRSKKSKILIDGSSKQCFDGYEKLTQDYESMGIFMVNEVNKEGTYVREFASIQNGHLLDLIICGGIISDIKKVKI